MSSKASADKELSEIYYKYSNFIKGGESKNEIICAYLNNSKAERDDKILRDLNPSTNKLLSGKSALYPITNEACLNGLLKMAQSNIIPIEYVELLYMSNGYNVSLDSLKKRTVSKSQTVCIDSIKAFFDKYRNDNSGKNPFEMYKKKSENKKYADNYIFDDSQKLEYEKLVNTEEEHPIKMAKSRYMSSKYDEILKIHDEINKLIEIYEVEQKKILPVIYLNFIKIYF